MSVIHFFIYSGTIAFAISGALLGIKKHFDFLGVTVLAMVTAVGGGAIRDIVVGSIPPSALKDEMLLSIIVLTSILTFFGHSILGKLNRTLFFFDAIGLALFSVVGAQKGMQAHLGIWGVLFTGSISGTGGSIIRDIFVDEIPSIFLPKEFYAGAAVLGSLCAYMVFYYTYNETQTLLIGGIVTFVIRYISHSLGLHLPYAKNVQL